MIETNRIIAAPLPSHRLDGPAFSDSVHTSAALRLSRTAAWQRSIRMKNISLFLAAILVVSTALAQNTQLKDERDKVSYSIGLDIGTTFKKQYMDINTDVMMTGLKDGLSGAKPAMSEEEIKATMTAYSKSMMENQAERTKETAAANQAKGEKFLAENKSKEGVKTTPSGLQYKVLKEGSGASPKE
ncbi:MAG: FKBP-type peptidyl-prolyl cis-trans isomerase N-terminal domain-containing protein, partial [Verrucomicrobiota bacterium]|nr:FKBP-type peptidyl-prolyl cis-trans isomerase N-terminal domain-containing protein [Verrucomicrobiota bacterium]